MATAPYPRDTPYETEHYESKARRMERGKIPRTLAGLLHWFVTRMAEETPERLHKSELWRDRVSNHEREEGIQSVGGSLTGSLAWAGSFRLMLESHASVTDEDGSYLFPVRSAMSRLHRRSPFMARYLFSLGMAEGDWKRLADDLGYEVEVMEVYVEACLQRLWNQTYDQATR